jgi:Uma2 family endonuclease
MAESQAHLLVMLWLIATLRQYYQNQPDVYVIGNMFLYWEEGHPEARKAPDVMVIKSVEPREYRDNFKIWEERATPSVIFEITSPGTADEDLQTKMELYQQLGVREYFLFDPRNEYLEQQLMGYRLINHVYEPIQPASNGGLVSSELMIFLVPEGAELGLFNQRTRERLPTPPQTHQLWLQAQDDLEKTRQRLAEIEKQAEAERHHFEEQLRLQQKQAEEQQRQLGEQLDQARRQTAELAEQLKRLSAAPTPPSDTP